MLNLNLRDGYRPRDPQSPKELPQDRMEHVVFTSDWPLPIAGHEEDYVPEWTFEAWLFLDYQPFIQVGDVCVLWRYVNNCWARREYYWRWKLWMGRVCSGSDDCC